MDGTFIFQFYIRKKKSARNLKPNLSCIVRHRTGAQQSQIGSFQISRTDKISQYHTVRSGRVLDKFSIEFRAIPTTTAGPNGVC